MLKYFCFIRINPVIKSVYCIYLQNYRIDTSLADNIIFLSEKDQHEMAKEINFVSKMPWNSFAGEIITPRNIIGVCFLDNTLNAKEVASLIRYSIHCRKKKRWISLRSCEWCRNDI